MINKTIFKILILSILSISHIDAMICPSGSYEVYTNHCVPCKSSCRSCTNSTNCLSCRNGFELIKDNCQRPDCSKNTSFPFFNVDTFKCSKCDEVNEVKLSDGYGLCGTIPLAKGSVEVKDNMDVVVSYSCGISHDPQDTAIDFVYSLGNYSFCYSLQDEKAYGGYNLCDASGSFLVDEKIMDNLTPEHYTLKQVRNTGEKYSLKIHCRSLNSKLEGFYDLYFTSKDNGAKYLNLTLEIPSSYPYFTNGTKKFEENYQAISKVLSVQTSQIFSNKNTIRTATENAYINFIISPNYTLKEADPNFIDIVDRIKKNGNFLIDLGKLCYDTQFLSYNVSETKIVGIQPLFNKVPEIKKSVKYGSNWFSLVLNINLRSQLAILFQTPDSATPTTGLNGYNPIFPANANEDTLITITNIKDTSKGFTIYYYTIGGLEFPYMKTDNYLNNKIIILKNEKPDNTSNNTNTNGTIPVVVPVESNNITNSSVPGNTNNSNNNNNKNSSNSGIYMKIGMIESLIIAITLILINY